MGIVLKEAMKIFPFSCAKLVGGAGGLERMVESANIQEVPEVERWLKGKEIVFSAGYAFHGEEENGCRLIEQLDRVGAAALALKPGEYLPAIPPAMIACADRLDFPLFELPEELPYMDCILPIFERITNEQLWVLQRVESVHEQLMQVMLRGEGLEGLCSLLNKFTGYPVFILAPDGAPFAFCADSIKEEGYLPEFLDFCGEYFKNRRYGALRRSQCNTLRCEGRSLICVPIIVQDEHIAFLVLDKQQSDLNETDMITLEQASSLISIELLKERSLVQQEQQMRGQLLEDLLMKRYSDPSVVLRRGHYFGLELDRSFAVFVIDADAFEGYLLQELSHEDEAGIQRVKQTAHQLIRRTLRERLGSLLLMENGVGMTGLAGMRSQADFRRCRDALRETVRALKAEFPKLDFSAGISRVKTGLDQAEDSWREARLALQAGRKLRRADRTSAFGELGTLVFLCELAGSRAVRDFYAETIGPLVRYDRENNSELVRTLECYFQCNGNLQETAKALFVHRNSVVYRLKKIKALLDRDLSDYETLFHLHLCLKIQEII